MHSSKVEPLAPRGIDGPVWFIRVNAHERGDQCTAKLSRCAQVGAKKDGKQRDVGEVPLQIRPWISRVRRCEYGVVSPSAACNQSAAHNSANIDSSFALTHHAVKHSYSMHQRI